MPQKRFPKVCVLPKNKQANGEKFFQQEWKNEEKRELGRLWTNSGFLNKRWQCDDNKIGGDQHR